MGDSDKNVMLLKNFLFLSRLLPEIPTEGREVFDENTRKSLIDFQNSVNLPATGILDNQTLKAIWTPVCPHGDTDVAAFTAILTTGWEKNTNLTWAIMAGPDDKGLGFVSSAISFACRQWKQIAHVPINFTQTTLDGAPVVTVEFDILKDRMEKLNQIYKPTMAAWTQFQGFKGEEPRKTMHIIFDSQRPWTSSPENVEISRAFDSFRSCHT